MTSIKGSKKFSADLMRLQSRPAEIVEEMLGAAAEKAEKAFIEAATGASTLKTPALKMRYSVKVLRGRGAVLTLRVSGKHSAISAVDVSPGLSAPTTGNARQAVYVSGMRGRPAVMLDRGFVWSRGVFVRPPGERRRFVSAKSLLSKAGARPSPAFLLGKSQDDVAAAAIEVLSHALEGL